MNDHQTRGDAAWRPDDFHDKHREARRERMIRDLESYLWVHWFRHVDRGRRATPPNAVFAGGADRPTPPPEAVRAMANA